MDVEVARVPAYEVDGFWRSLRQAWDRYRLPLALTEVHLGGGDEDEVAWWAEAWQQAGWAVEAGIPVEAVTTWSAFGAVDWDSLLRRESGSYRPGCFDVRSGEAVLTPLGAAVAATASGVFVAADRTGVVASAGSRPQLARSRDRGLTPAAGGPPCAAASGL